MKAIFHTIKSTVQAHPWLTVGILALVFMVIIRRRTFKTGGGGESAVEVPAPGSAGFIGPMPPPDA